MQSEKTTLLASGSHTNHPGREITGRIFLQQRQTKGLRKIYLYIYEKAIERDGKKWGKVCKARSDAAKAKHAKEEISAKAAIAAKATDKDNDKEKEYVYDKEKEKERSAPNNRTSKEKLLAEYSSSCRRGRGFERRGARSVQARILKARKVKYQLLASCF